MRTVDVLVFDRAAAAPPAIDICLGTDTLDEPVERP